MAKITYAQYIELLMDPDTADEVIAAFSTIVPGETAFDPTLMPDPNKVEMTADQIEALTAPLLPSSSDFGWPVPNPVIVSRFGTDNNSYLALQAGSRFAPVQAIEAGVVVNVQNLSANDGFVVVVQHGQDLLVSYTNLQQPIVSPRERVTKGQHLGNLGGGTLVDDDVLKLWVMVGSTFVDPQARLGF